MVIRKIRQKILDFAIAVNPSRVNCQPNLEMSSFSQSRNVRFMGSPPSHVFFAPVAGVGATDDPASV
jgi:hypothetical protein